MFHYWVCDKHEFDRWNFFKFKIDTWYISGQLDDVFEVLYVSIFGMSLQDVCLGKQRENITNT